MRQEKIAPGLLVALDRFQKKGSKGLTQQTQALGIVQPWTVQSRPALWSLFTATLSANAVADLTVQPRVKYLKLSRKLHPLNKSDIFNFY